MSGKRPRPPMKRTTNMSEITLDQNTSTYVGRGGGGGLDQGQSKVLLNNTSNDSVSPCRIQRRHSADLVETPDFLRACCLCKRPLVPARDIYMYRGDRAFCSLECREQQMNRDERKEKWCVASKKQVAGPPSSSGAQVTNKGETVAAL